MSENSNRFDTLVVTKNGLVSINLRDTMARIAKLIKDHHGYKVINMEHLTKDQVEHFLKQLHKTDGDAVSDKHEPDETTLTADSQDFMEMSDDNDNNSPTLTLDVSAFGPTVSPRLSESSLINDDNNEPEDVSMVSVDKEVSMDQDPDQFFCSDCGKLFYNLVTGLVPTALTYANTANKMCQAIILKDMAY